MKNGKPEKSKIARIIALLFNPKVWSFLWKCILRFLFPSSYPILKLYDLAPEASLIGLDGVTKYSLREDFFKKTTLPLIVNIGSYN